LSFSRPGPSWNQTAADAVFLATVQGTAHVIA
jgi:hypothetical protein